MDLEEAQSPSQKERSFEQSMRKHASCTTVGTTVGAETVEAIRLRYSLALGAQRRMPNTAPTGHTVQSSIELRSQEFLAREENFQRTMFQELNFGSLKTKQAHNRKAVASSVLPMTVMFA